MVIIIVEFPLAHLIVFIRIYNKSNTSHETATLVYPHLLCHLSLVIRTQSVVWVWTLVPQQKWVRTEALTTEFLHLSGQLRQ
jgi:hypothetical protein